MSAAENAENGRAYFERRAWARACDSLAAQDETTPLSARDLELYARAADLAGREAGAVWTRAHHAYLGRGDAPGAARCAYRLGLGLMMRGERAPAAGWFARARRLLDECGEDCVERGYLILPDAMMRVLAGDNAGGLELFEAAQAVGARFGDASLVALARTGCGRTLIRLGRIEDGVALLDEVMAGITADEVTPFVAGEVYCTLIEGCHEIFDVRRAQEWTAVLSEWVEAQPELVPYRGQCLIRRAEVLQLRGAWSVALDEASRACAELTRPPPQRAAGAAFYQQAELHRLRGEFADAESAYREASERGRRPDPGLALLRLAQGQAGAAAAAIRRTLDEATGELARCRMLPAHAEIMLAAGDVAAARASADELDLRARTCGGEWLHASAAYIAGAVLLAEGDARGALGALRDAWSAWEEMKAPYEAARTRVVAALAYRALEDADSARLELDAARHAFLTLGAAPDLARIDALDVQAQSASDATSPLTTRELQVLRLVATGRTNRAIAQDLYISEKTVARHVSNIFMKLSLSSRAAATAFAYEHNLI